MKASLLVGLFAQKSIFVSDRQVHFPSFGLCKHLVIIEELKVDQSFGRLINPILSMGRYNVSTFVALRRVWWTPCDPSTNGVS